MMRSKLLLCVLASFVLFSSCKKEEVYSCNKEVNEWVNEHLDEVRVMTRTEWKELSPVLGKACFVAFLPQQKVEFWDLKMEQVLSLDWSEAERAHLIRLRSFLASNSYIFDPALLYEEANYDKFDRFMYSWSDDAQEELGWTRELIGSIAASGYDLKAPSVQLTQGDVAIVPNTQGLGGYQLSCNCNHEHDFCESGTDCIDSDCEDGWGCGWVWLQRCDGRCADRQRLRFELNL